MAYVRSRHLPIEVALPAMIANPPEAPLRAEAAGDPATLADLVEQIARNGDRAAFARLFNHYAPRVKAHLLGEGVNPAEAEDMAVDVMVAVWRKAAGFDRRVASVDAWIFRIARNRSLERLQPERRASPCATVARSKSPRSLVRAAAVGC